MAKAPNGQIYFMNHITKTTQWEDPRKVSRKRGLIKGQFHEIFFQRSLTRLGDAEGPQRTDLLHEPYHQDHTVGGGGDPRKVSSKRVLIKGQFRKIFQRSAARLGDGEGAQRADLLHEPYHQDHTVGGSQKGEPKGYFSACVIKGQLLETDILYLFTHSTKITQWEDSRKVRLGTNKAKILFYFFVKSIKYRAGIFGTIYGD
jgi:hypothetical protein